MEANNAAKRGARRGILLNHEDKERILKVVRGVPGVERVDMDVMVMPTEYG
jgi:hypothetical protein